MRQVHLSEEALMFVASLYPCVLMLQTQLHISVFLADVGVPINNKIKFNVTCKAKDQSRMT